MASDRGAAATPPIGGSTQSASWSIHRNISRMENVFRDSSKAFREISFIAVAWLKDTHHSVQKQEARLEQVEQDTRDQGREIHANTAGLSCMQASYELHRERLERLEGIVHSQEQALFS